MSWLAKQEKEASEPSKEAMREHEEEQVIIYYYNIKHQRITRKCPKKQE